jgi:hypothetical protein
MAPAYEPGLIEPRTLLFPAWRVGRTPFAT